MSQRENPGRKDTAPRESVGKEKLPQRLDGGGEKMAQLENTSMEKILQPKDFPEKGGSERAMSEMLSERDRLYRENLAKEIIAYLSKEIETVTHDMMLFRSKITFSVLVGPFLILGTLVYAAKGMPFSTNLGILGWIAVFILCFCYFALAYVAGRIEEDGWRQCNEWRKLISALQRDPTIEIDEKNVRKDKQGIDPVDWMARSYLIAFVFLLGSFVCSIFVLSRVWPPPAPTTPPAATAPGSTRSE